LRLITKINSCLAVILTVLMLAVFSFSQYFFKKELKELEAQMKNSLQIAYEGLKITTDNDTAGRGDKADSQWRRDLLDIATKDRSATVLNNYLKLAAEDYCFNIQAALRRQKLFLLALTGFGLLFGICGSQLLASNIKKSIFGMEPTEIAALLDQRTQAHEFMNKLQSVSGLIQLGRYETALTLLHETTASHQKMVSFLTTAFPNSAVSGILLGKFNQAKKIHIQLEIDNSSYIPEDCVIPDHELVCIVGNLIENAFEALLMAPRSPKKVTVRFRTVKQSLQIVITDNGPGIPKTIRKLIFNRGFTSKKGVNKGIGLSLVKQSVENLRGLIRFHSSQNGTIFWVKIPF
jgi:sensor histidine kinase regulating citrate/malate metabolism